MFTFIDIDVIQHIHQSQIEQFGGEPGVRDVGLLDSAVAMPKAMFGGVFLHEDIYEMAAAYLYHIVQNHPFFDGNKRTGTAVAIEFLKLNGLKFLLDKEALIDMVLEVAQGRLKKAQIAEFFRQNIAH